MTKEERDAIFDECCDWLMSLSDEEFIKELDKSKDHWAYKAIVNNCEGESGD